LKPWIYRGASVFVSLLFVYLAVRQVDLSQAFGALAGIQPSVLGAATLVYLASFPVRALRWRLVLRAQKTLTFGEMLGPVFVGYMANNVLPARAGEIYRAHFLGRSADMSRSGVAASIVVERAFDGLMMVAVMALVAAMFPEAHFLGVTAGIVALVFVLLAVGIALHSLAAGGTGDLSDRLIRRLPESLREIIEARLKFFLQGMKGVSTAREALATAGYTGAIWSLEFLALALAVYSFGVSIPFAGYALVFALTALGTTLPSGPGYVGPYQYAFVLSLGVFDVARETALAISVAAQICLLGSVTVIGLVLLLNAQLRSGAGLRNSMKSSKRTKGGNIG